MENSLGMSVALCTTQRVREGEEKRGEENEEADRSRARRHSNSGRSGNARTTRRVLGTSSEFSTGAR